MKKCLLVNLFFLLMLSTSYSQPLDCGKMKTDPYFVPGYDTLSNKGPFNIVRHVREDKKGNVWLATWHGIMKFDPVTKLFTNYMLKENLIPFHTFSIFEDKKGDLWFGTVRGGMYKYDGKSWQLFTTENGLANDLVGNFMEDNKGKLWIATDGGISIYDPSVPISPGSRAGIITPGGLNISNKKAFTNYTEKEGLIGDRVNCILQDKTGKIWIATRTGVCVWDTSVMLTASGKYFSEFKIKQGVPFTNTWCIIQDRNGKIWFGGADGLYRYDPSLEGEKALNKIAPNFVGNIFEDKAGNMWFNGGVQGGMSLFKYDGKEITTVMEKTAPGDSQVFEITQDKSGNIWFGTMRGVCRYDGKTFERFGR
jgi:ligand-binding sensor domain-containing protein